MQNQIRYLLWKYLEGDLTEGERETFFVLLKSGEGQEALDEMIDEKAQELLFRDLELGPEVSRRMWEKLDSRMDDPPKAGINWKWIGWAASFLILCCAGGILWLRQGGREHLTYQTEVSQKRTVILPDGTLVTLNSDSEITYREEEGAREVGLSGEAYFDVKHEKDRPFFVSTKDIRVKVLGTSFNVRAYGSDERISTTLLRGKVRLESRNRESRPVEMDANQQVNFDRAENVFVPGRMEDYYEADWRSGNLVFENEPLKNILPELEKWYGVPFEIDESLLDCRFSMAIGDEGLDELLRFFELSAGNRMARLPGGGVRLSGPLCN